VALRVMPGDPSHYIDSRLRENDKTFCKNSAETIYLRCFVLFIVDTATKRRRRI